MMSSDDSKTVFLNNDSNWSTYKYYVITYCGKIRAESILDGTEVEPIVPILPDVTDVGLMFVYNSDFIKFFQITKHVNEIWLIIYESLSLQLLWDIF